MRIINVSSEKKKTNNYNRDETKTSNHSNTILSECCYQGNQHKEEDITMGTQGEEDLDLRGNSCHREEEQQLPQDRRLKLGFFDLSARESEEEGGGGIKGSVRGTRSLIGRDELIYLSYPNTVDNFSSLLEKLTENPNPFTASSRKKKKKIKHSDEYKTERKKKTNLFF